MLPPSPGPTAGAPSKLALGQGYSSEVEHVIGCATSWVQSPVLLLKGGGLKNPALTIVVLLQKHRAREAVSSAPPSSLGCPPSPPHSQNHLDRSSGPQGPHLLCLRVIEQKALSSSRGGAGSAGTTVEGQGALQIQQSQAVLPLTQFHKLKCQACTSPMQASQICTLEEQERGRLEGRQSIDESCLREAGGSSPVRSWGQNVGKGPESVQTRCV